MLEPEYETQPAQRFRQPGPVTQGFKLGDALLQSLD